MTKQVSETVLLPEMPNIEAEPVKQGVLEDKQDPNAPHVTRVTLKSGDAFLVADTCGDFPASRQEMGLFWHGTRFLRTCNLFLEGRPLMVLSHHVADMGDACQIDLTNPPFTTNQETVIEQGTIHVCRLLEVQRDQLVQTITITSFQPVLVPLTLSLNIGADFRDLFEVRGRVREKRGKLALPRMNDEMVILGYRGLDDIKRETCLMLTPPADNTLANKISWQLHLTRGQPIELCIRVKLSESETEPLATDIDMPSWHSLPQPTIQTNDALFNRLLTRGMNDLMMLSTMTPYGHYPYAGIPWFSCPFGRDGLITCLEFLPWFPDVVRGTLGFLAAHQGTKVEAFTDEEPGKILHEMRTGEMANLREVPYIPYYGTIDATPLFLITLEAYIRWTNDLAFLEQHWPNAEAAARWLIEYGDKDGDTFIEYCTASEKGLANQGWKDAWDSVSHSDGRLATSPVALCEVQGYAFAAYRAMSYLAERLGKTEEAVHWLQVAETLRENFLQRFWWEEEQVFYQALNGSKEPCDVVTSNPGQCLWTGIVPEDKARKIMDRLMREDMYSGWGIRTLSTQAARYNPMSYHNGSVWPHDTAIVGTGFAQFGGKAQAGQLLKSMLETSHYYDGARLPELHCGFPRRSGYGPTRYPVACSPQAWAAGAPFLLVNALLGFQPNAERCCLTLHQPTLPGWLQTMEIRGLRIGEQQLHLHLVRSGERTEVIMGDDNEVDVEIV
ncbi:MAG: amylo-alpha-1,6-glucosidase [Chloroflexi bacterium]|nr:amylo-alpha-1,6-glucosidase [Chloroflexota bacterium]